MGYQWYQKINQCEWQTIHGNNQSKEQSDNKRENKRSPKLSEIKLGIL